MIALFYGMLISLLIVPPAVMRRCNAYEKEDAHEQSIANDKSVLVEVSVDTNIGDSHICLHR